MNVVSAGVVGVAEVKDQSSRRDRSSMDAAAGGWLGWTVSAL